MSTTMGRCEYRTYSIRPRAGYDRLVADGENPIDALFIEHECQSGAVTYATYDDPNAWVDRLAVCGHHDSLVTEENAVYHYFKERQ